MTKNLPNTNIPHAASTLVEKRKYFPSIFRFIPESLVLSQIIYWTKIISISFIAGILLLQIVTQSVALYENVQKIQRLKLEREQIAGEIRYLKSLEQTYSGYRDIYFRIAALEYKRGNSQESKKYIQKALELDPNFQEGRVLGEKVGL